MILSINIVKAKKKQKKGKTWKMESGKKLLSEQQMVAFLYVADGPYA